jgi:hypothetical protein
MLSGVVLQLVTEVPGRPVRPIFKGQVVQGKGLLALSDPRR